MLLGQRPPVHQAGRRATRHHLVVLLVLGYALPFRRSRWRHSRVVVLRRLKLLLSRALPRLLEGLRRDQEGVALTPPIRVAKELDHRLPRIAQVMLGARSSGG